MDKITVAELASECTVQNQVVLAELKKLGLYVFSPTATIDANFAETIRKKILSQRDAEVARHAEAEKKAEHKKEKEAEAAKKAEKKAPKKAGAPKPEEEAVEVAPSPEVITPETAAARKAKKAAPKLVAVKEKKAIEEQKPAEEAQKPSLQPRKGRKHFDRETLELVEAGAQAAPKPIDLTPSEIARQFLSEPAPVVEITPPEFEPEPAPEPVETKTLPAPAVEPEPAPVVEASKAAEHAPRTPEAPPHAGTVAKKIIIPKAKTKILMRTSTEKVVTPDITEKILRASRRGRRVRGPGRQRGSSGRKSPEPGPSRSSVLRKSLNCLARRHPRKITGQSPLRKV
jgi:hypothetical protein